ncbi:hypothetical protein V2J09_017622 [Rumex salicifolius]
MSYARVVSRSPSTPPAIETNLEKVLGEPVGSPLYADLDALFREEDFSHVFVGRGQEDDTSQDEYENMPLQRRLAETDFQIAALIAQIDNRAEESQREQVRTNDESPTNSSSISPQEIKDLIAQGIREFQISQNPPVLGYRKPYPWVIKDQILTSSMAFMDHLMSILPISTRHAPANDFIARWRSLRLQCPEKSSEEACVQMCTNNLILEMIVDVGSAEPRSFDALV